MMTDQRPHCHYLTPVKRVELIKFSVSCIVSGQLNGVQLTKLLAKSFLKYISLFTCSYLVQTTLSADTLSKNMNQKHHKIVFPRIPQILIVSCYENSKKRKLNGLERLLRHLTVTASSISSGNVDFFPYREDLDGVLHLDRLLLLLFLQKK